MGALLKIWPRESPALVSRALRRRNGLLRVHRYPCTFSAGLCEGMVWLLSTNGIAGGWGVCHCCCDFLHESEVRRISTMKWWTCELTEGITLEKKNKARRWLCTCKDGEGRAWTNSEGRSFKWGESVCATNSFPLQHLKGQRYIPYPGWGMPFWKELASPGLTHTTTERGRKKNNVNLKCI